MLHTLNVPASRDVDFAAKFSGETELAWRSAVESDFTFVRGDFFAEKGH